MTKWIGKSTQCKSKTVYHIDKECERLRSEPMEVHPSEIEYHNLRCCDYCNPETPDPKRENNSSFKHYEALKAAARENAE